MWKRTDRGQVEEPGEEMEMILEWIEIDKIRERERIAVTHS